MADGEQEECCSVEALAQYEQRAQSNDHSGEGLSTGAKLTEKIDCVDEEELVRVTVEVLSQTPSIPHNQMPAGGSKRPASPWNR